MQIGWDVDGVLSNFDRQFIKLLNEMFGLNIPENQLPLSWSWFEFIDELTQDMETRAWDEIYNKQSEFFYTMSPLIGFKEVTRINRLSSDHNMVFITSRQAKGCHQNVQAQTRAWLGQRGLVHSDNVFLSRSEAKGKTGRMLGVHVAIDDSGPAVMDYLRHDVPAVMLRKPHNQGFVELVKENPGGHVVDSVPEFIDLLTRWHVRQEEIDEFPTSLAAVMP